MSFHMTTTDAAVRAMPSGFTLVGDTYNSVCRLRAVIVTDAALTFG